jgi:hypothetical protein
MWDEGKIRDWFLLHPHYLIESKGSAPIGCSASQQTPSREHRLSEKMSEQNQEPKPPEKPQCPPRHVWSPQQQKCVPQAELEVQEQQNQQEEKPTCPAGYVWNPEQQKCVPKTEIAEQHGPEQPKCPEGQVWDPQQQKCVPEEQLGQPQLQERVWTRNYINNLPDSAFALILLGGEKDQENKTSPRTLRKFPHHNANGAIDLPHLRNALARVPQSNLTDEQKERALAHLRRHAKAAGIGEFAEAKRILKEQNEQGEEVGEVEFEIAPEPTMDEVIASVEDVVSQINDAIEALTRRIERLEQAVQKGEGGQSVAEQLLKTSQNPNLIDKREILKLIPPQRVVRSWSYGPRLLVNQLRHKLTESKSS